MTRRKKAQAMVEFAMVLPVLLLLVFGLLEFGRLLYAWIIIENATRFGVRYATTGNFDATYCPTPGDATSCSTDALEDAARIPSIKDATTQIIVGLPYDESLTNADQNYLHVTVCSTRISSNGSQYVWIAPEMEQPIYASCSPNEDPGGPRDTVVVGADYNFTFIVFPRLPFVAGFIPMIHLASYREGTVENFRATRSIDTPLPLLIPTVNTNTPLPTKTFTPTLTFTPSNTPTQTNTPTSTPTKTPTRTPTSTFTPSNTPTKTNTPTITFTPSKTNTPTITFTPSKTFTPTVTFTPTFTFTPSKTFTPSNTPTKTFTPTITFTPSKTFTPTITFTPSKTPTFTPSNTPRPTRTPTPTFTPSNTPTKTPTLAPPTPIPTNAPTPTPTVCFNNC
ncbi:MAG TPA: TadE/TadG family type IV pilus assembly protein [Anaerolineales bacterium]|nr:TadE/TadG family type IV pilus assembly protein [Anaerolineales bacterium]